MDTVPPELGALILSNVADMDSLWAFVRASRHMYFIFNEYRERVLSVVIAREIGPTLIGEASAALSSSRLTSIQNKEGENTEGFVRGLPKSEALAWIENCYLPKTNACYWVEDYLLLPDKLKWGKMNDRRRANRQTILQSSKDILLLWELHKDVKFIAETYVRDTLHIFYQNFQRDPTGPGNTQAPNTFENLSNAEKERILRVIYRFAIFGNLFAPSPISIWDEEELCEYFLCRFTAWQWQEMEDNEFSRLAADPTLWEIEPRPDPWNCRWDADFFSKMSKSISFEDKQEYVATLPIKDLRAIFQAEGQTLEDLIKQWTWGSRYEIGPFLGEALRVDPQYFHIIPDGGHRRRGSQQHAWGIGPMPFFDRATDGDDAALANIGWNWANGWYPHEVYGAEYISATSLGYGDREGFRRFGYVFWDSQRWKFIGNTSAESLGKETLSRFPRPCCENPSLSVEERIRQLAGCECGDVIRPEDTTCKIKGHKVKFTYPCGPGAIGEEV